MSHDHKTVTGDVTDIFAHRIVVRTPTGTILADLGPKGAQTIRLKTGDRVELTGAMRPSELKVHRIAKDGAQPIAIDHHKTPHHDDQEDADPRPALKTAEANGFTVLGRPRRKPNHVEILGRDASGDLVELHIECDGGLRKTRPIAADDPKWAAELKQMASITA